MSNSSFVYINNDTPIADGARWSGTSFNPHQVSVEIFHGDWYVGRVVMDRHDAMHLAMSVIASLTAPFGELQEHERAFFRYVVAEDTIRQRHNELCRQYGAREISETDLRRRRELLEQQPCWPTETIEELKRAVVPLVDLDRRRPRRPVH